MGYRWSPNQPCCLAPTPSGFVTTRKYSSSTPPVQLWRRDDGQYVSGVRLEPILGDLNVLSVLSGNIIYTQYDTSGTSQWTITGNAGVGGFLAVDSAATIFASFRPGDRPFAYDATLSYGVVDGYRVATDVGAYQGVFGPSSGHSIGVAIDSSNNRITVPAALPATNCRIAYTSGDMQRGLLAGGGPFVIDSSGNLYCANAHLAEVGATGCLIRKISPAGELLWEYALPPSSNTHYIIDLALDSTGRLIAAFSVGVVTGGIIAIDGSGALDWRTDFPFASSVYQLDVDPTTDDIYICGELYISAGVMYAAQKYDSTGTLQWSAGLPSDFASFTANRIVGTSCVFSGSSVYVAVVVGDGLGVLYRGIRSYDSAAVVGYDWFAPNAPGAITNIKRDSSYSIYAAVDNSVVALPFDLSTNTTISTDAGYELYIDSSDVVWTVGSSGLYGMDTSGTVLYGPYANRSLNNVSQNNRNIASDAAGDLWLYFNGYEYPHYYVRPASVDSGYSIAYSKGGYIAGFIQGDAIGYATGAVFVSGGDVLVSGTDVFVHTGTGHVTASPATCVRKFNGGQLVWDGPDGPIGYSVVADGSGNSYVGGSRVGGLTFGANTLSAGNSAAQITGGTFALRIQSPQNNTQGTTSPIAYNASAATVQSAIRAIVGSSQANCTGGPLPGTDIVVAWAGGLSYAIVEVDDSLLTPGPHTTVKIDSSGAVVWRVDHGADVYSVAVDGSGSVYTGGNITPTGTMIVDSGGAGSTNYILTTGSITGGTFTISVYRLVIGIATTAPIVYNASAATIQAALNAVLGAGHATVTGGPLPSSMVFISVTDSLTRPNTVDDTLLVTSQYTTRKYDSSGTLLWSVSHGDAVYSLDVDASGNAYTGGVRTPLP